MEKAASLIERISRGSHGAGGAIEGMSGKMRALGVASLGVTAAVVGFLAESERAAVGYQDALTKVQVITNGTAAQTTELQHALSSLAVGTLSTGTDMANALAPVAGELKQLEGASYGAASATNVLGAAQSLVESSGGNLATTTKTLTDLLLVYHEKSTAAVAISDSLFQAHGVLGMGVDRLGMMLQRLQPRIAGTGVDLNTLLGLVVKLTPSFGTGQRAMMQVGAVLQGMSNPTKGAQKALQSLGISATDSKGKFIGFVPLITSLHDQLSKVRDPLQRSALLTAIFGRNAKAMGEVVAGGAAGIAQATAALQAHGTAAQGAETMMSDAKHQMELLPKTIERVSETIGMVLLPPLNRLLLAIEPILNGIAQWVTDNPELATAILVATAAVTGLVGASVFLGPVLAMIGGLLGVITSPLAIVVGAITLLGATLSQNKPLMAEFALVFTRIKDDLAVIAAPFGRFVGAVIDLFTGKGSVDAVGTAFSELMRTVRHVLPDIMAGVGVFASQLGPVLKGAFDGVVEWVRDTGLPMLGTALGKMVDGFVAMVGDGSTIKGIANQLATWTLQFVNWAASTALSVGSGILSGIGDALRGKSGGTGSSGFGGALVTLAGSIIGGIADAIGKNPLAIAQAIGALLMAKAVTSAVGTAAATLGAAFKGSLTTATPASPASGAAGTTGGSGLMNTIQKVALVGMAADVAVQLAGAFAQQSAEIAKQGADLAAQAKAWAPGATRADLQAAIAQIDQQRTANFGLNALALAITDPFNHGLQNLNATQDALRKQLATMDANLQGGMSVIFQRLPGDSVSGHSAGGWVGLDGPEIGLLGEKGPEYVIPNHKLGGIASGIALAQALANMAGTKTAVKSAHDTAMRGIRQVQKHHGLQPAIYDKVGGRAGTGTGTASSAGRLAGGPGADSTHVVQIRATHHVVIDGRVIAETVSQLLAVEERQFSGAAGGPGTMF